ncbi:MAG TPA: hypothetical protein VH302_08155 [Bryobacteraceae bacterium]|jgi:hypothetical protein|nr:hypothetical protein [Bryobacteraceae bacterium]
MANWFSTADRVLAARVEAAESENMMRLADSLKRVQRDAAYEPFAGGVAVFAGVGSGMTHAVGIGMRFTPAEELERMEGFFRDRGSPCVIDLCALADESVIGHVQTKPYRVAELNNVLARRIGADEEFGSMEGIEPVQEDRLEQAGRVILEGFSEAMPFPEDALPAMRASLEASHVFVSGHPTPVAAAAVGFRSGVAMFYGDATLAAGRRSGSQSKLIQARLAAARQQSCDLAVATVLPGSGSHRNYERAGFQLIYMRVNVCRDFK